MNAQMQIALFLVLVVIASLFGLPLMLASPMHHEMGCPFSQGMAAICEVTVFEHLKYWQFTFASIVVEVLTIAALALLVWSGREFVVLRERRETKTRIRVDRSMRPTLFQELYSRGIHNRKEPFSFSR